MALLSHMMMAHIGESLGVRGAGERHIGEFLLRSDGHDDGYPPRPRGFRAGRRGTEISAGLPVIDRLTVIL